MPNKPSEAVISELLAKPSRPRLVELIQKHLLTESQARFFKGNGLSVEDVLDGNIIPDDMDVIDAVFADWNKACGGNPIFKLK